MLHNKILAARHNSRSYLLLMLHLLTLCGAALLIVVISYDAIRKITFISDPVYLHMQFWICLLFIVDILVEAAMAGKPWRALLANMPFLLVCIPYLNILGWCHVHLSGQLTFLLRFIPLIRAAGVFAIITGFITRNKIESLFRGYIVMLLTLIYFASLMFFVMEHGINKAVTGYGIALWWAVMNMTTTGSNIVEYTEIGKILAIALAGAGLILIPMLTVYITNLTGGKSE